MFEIEAYRTDQAESYYGSLLSRVVHRFGMPIYLGQHDCTTTSFSKKQDNSLAAGRMFQEAESGISNCNIARNWELRCSYCMLLSIGWASSHAQHHSQWCWIGSFVATEEISLTTDSCTKLNRMPSTNSSQHQCQAIEGMLPLQSSAGATILNLKQKGPWGWTSLSRLNNLFERSKLGNHHFPTAATLYRWQE